MDGAMAFDGGHDLNGRMLAIRADADVVTGTGHVMRCLALAQAWQDAGGRVTFVMADPMPSIEGRLKSEEIAVLHLPAAASIDDDARQFTEIAEQKRAAAVVIDGYGFGADYQRIVKQRGHYGLFLDDNEHAEHYWADAVLNQNVYADDGWYANRETYARRLLGTRFALLRREFVQRPGRERRVPPVARNVLVTLGGGDADNITLTVIRAIDRVAVDGLEIAVVIGSINPHADTLESAARCLRHAVRVERNATNMPELMAWADLAVTAGGSTCWETAYMGLPSCAVVLAENQRRNVARLAELKQVIGLGDAADVCEDQLCSRIEALLADQVLRQKMSDQGRDLVDGQGARRVVAVMRKADVALANC